MSTLGLFGTAHKRKRRKPVYKKYKTYSYDFHGRKLDVQGYERQALEYLEQHFPHEDILTECEFGDMLKLRYKYSKRTRTYYPDIFIRNVNLVVEVKSMSTLGLLNNKKRGFSMTCQKAIACHKRGFKFCLLLLTSSGKRLYLPKRWMYMKKQDVINYVRENN